MAVCLVVCSECGKRIEGSDPSRMEFRMAASSRGKIVPLCPPCFDDRRTT